MEFIWRMKKLDVDLEAVLLKNWCHGVLSFDLKSGIDDSHKANVLNVKWFKEIFDNKRVNSLSLKVNSRHESPMLSLNSPHMLKYPKKG